MRILYPNLATAVGLQANSSQILHMTLSGGHQQQSWRSEYFSSFSNPEFIADVHSVPFVKVTETLIIFFPKHVSTFKFITFSFPLNVNGKS